MKGNAAMVQTCPTVVQGDNAPLGIHAQDPEADPTLVEKTRQALETEETLRKRAKDPPADPLDDAGYNSIGSGRR